MLCCFTGQKASVCKESLYLNVTFVSLFIAILQKELLCQTMLAKEPKCWEYVVRVRMDVCVCVLAVQHAVHFFFSICVKKPIHVLSKEPSCHQVQLSQVHTCQDTWLPVTNERVPEDQCLISCAPPTQYSTHISLGLRPCNCSCGWITLPLRENRVWGNCS